jgi:repressor LexA
MITVRCPHCEKKFTAGAREPHVSGVTRHQRDLLEFIISYTAENNGVPPTIREMRDWSGLASMSGVYRLVSALEERGLIRRLPNRARSIVVVGALA